MKPLDATDRRILSALAVNARQSVSSLASDLGLARTTVQARLDRLERDKVILGYRVQINAAATRDAIRATVLVQVEPRATPSLLKRLTLIAEVEIAHTTSGRYDLALQVSAQGTQALDQLLDRIGDLDGVQRLESLIHLSTRIDRAG